MLVDEKRDVTDEPCGSQLDGEPLQLRGKPLAFSVTRGLQRGRELHRMKERGHHAVPPSRPAQLCRDRFLISCKNISQERGT